LPISRNHKLPYTLPESEVPSLRIVQDVTTSKESENDLMILALGILNKLALFPAATNTREHFCVGKHICCIVLVSFAAIVVL
jgi:hypothetical protein